MKRQAVSSSLIASIGLEEGPQGPVMEIEFAKGGKVYQYTGPKVREHYGNLMKAESVGKYFLRNVKTCPDTKYTQVPAGQS
jgi:hypothetical protein